jgi:hypothetical protein
MPGGERAATIYTLLGTAKLNGLDPELYLRHVLERIADHPINRIHALLPWNLGMNQNARPHKSLHHIGQYRMMRQRVEPLQAKRAICGLLARQLFTATVVS